MSVDLPSVRSLGVLLHDRPVGVIARAAGDKYKKASYSTISRVLWGEAGERSVAEFLRRFVFSVLIGNADMHLKN